jgi:hypothetical protein
MSKMTAFLALILIPAGLVVSTINVSAQSETPVTVQGSIFVDGNANGIYESSETPVPGVVLGFSNGTEEMVTATSGVDGRYAVSLTAGRWQGTVLSSEGYTIPAGLALEFNLDPGETAEINFDIPLFPVIVEEPPVDSEPGSETIPDPESTATPGEDESPAPADDQEAPGDENQDESEGLYVLPESGGTIPSRWIGLGGSALLFFTAVILIMVGKRMLRS